MTPRRTDDAAEPTPTSESTETTTPEPDATSSTPARPEPKPENGDCRVLGWDDTGEAVTEAGDKPVPCARDHTAQTIATGQLEQGLDPAVDPDAVAAAVSRECRVHW